MENQSNSVHSLFERAGDYLETRIDLLKLQAVDRSSELISSLVSRLIIALILVLFIFLLNIGVAMWLGDIIGNAYAGFFIVAGFYALVCIIVYAARKKLLQTPVGNKLIKKMLN